MNKPPANPSEVARETLRQLAMRRTPPTPDNYRTLYHEIAGTQVVETFPERALKSVAAALPRDSAEQAKFARQFDLAVANGNWDGIRGALTEFSGRAGSTQANWSALIREMLGQLDKHHAGITPAKKREALEHVLAASSTAELLFGRLQSVIKTWNRNPAGEEQALVDAIAGAPAAEAVASSPAPAATKETKTVTAASSGLAELQGLVAQLLDNVVAVMVADNTELHREAEELSAAVRAAVSAESLLKATERLKKFAYRLHFVAEDQAELKAGLMHLLQLIIDNIGELVVEDKWLIGQISVVRDLVREPLNLRRLDDVERRMKDLIFKQSSLKQNLNDAKDRLKLMLATFVDRLADFSESTSGYHDKIEACAVRISEANDIAELSDVLDEVMRETRVIQLNAQRSRDELFEMRAKVAESEAEINRLHDELAHASEMVRHDALTGALNRKGLQEAMDAEVARMKRHKVAMCLALLDIDNFKKLNDSLGHDAGDAALIHLTKVVQETIRPEDVLGRYGGEEFVVLLPDTEVQDGVTAMIRVQRELTRRFFLHNNEKLLITFSCGIAELGMDEDPAAALKRADEAMYLAKRSGKNRVVPA